MAKEAKVVYKVAEDKVVINLGSDDGIMIGDKFLIYGLGDKIIDDGEYLETLELTKGVGVAVHVQKKITTLDSDTYIDEGSTTEIITPESPFAKLSYLGTGFSQKKIIHPKKKREKFDKVEIGDFARRLDV